MSWSTVRFGKYAGKSLPEILITDPDWFYYMLPKLYGSLRDEADELALRARAIRIPKKRPKRFAVEYRYDSDGSFAGFRIVKENRPCHSKHATRLPHLDLSLVIGGRTYDKRSGRIMIRDFRINYFGEGKHLNRNRCDRFFSDDRNFLYV
jgi:hypothetical protein